MAYNPSYQREKRRVRASSVFPMILLFLVIIGVSFYAGMLWEKMQKESVETVIPGSQSSQSASQSQSQPQQSGGSTASLPESSASSEVEPTPTPTEEPTPTPEPSFVPLVEKTDYCDLTYFDDAVFVGDSVTSGLSGYGLFEPEQVLADTSINFESILYKKPFTDLNGQYVNTYDAVVCRSPKKVYIMLGANGIEWINLDRLMGYYETFVTGLQELLPDTLIYVQSVLPVTEALDSNPDRDLTNAKIDAYNLALYELATRLKVYYLNVTEDFKDENGCLPSDASPFDGLHFSKSYYNIWLEYLRNHALTAAQSGGEG